MIREEDEVRGEEEEKEKNKNKADDEPGAARKL